MKKIEYKIKRLFWWFFIGGIGVLLMVSGVTLWGMRKSGEESRREMTKEAVAGSAGLLTEEITAQAERYVDCFAELLGSRLSKTSMALAIVAGNIEELYSRPQGFAAVSVPYGKDLQGTQPCIHWLPEQGMQMEGEMQSELFLLGNAGAVFARFAEENSQILRIYFTSSSGINVGYDGDYEKKPDTFEGRQASWYQAAQNQDGLVLSEAYTDTFVEQLTVTYSMPVKGEDGTLLGVLAADMLIDDLEQMIEHTNLEFNGYAMLVSGSGRMVAAKGLTAENAEDRERFLGENGSALLGSQEAEGIQVTESKIGGRSKYLFLTPVAPMDWTLALALDRQEMEDAALDNADALHKIEENSTQKAAVQFALTCLIWLVTAAVVIAVGFAMAGRISNRISRPIEELCRDVKRIGEGEFSYEAHIHTGDEIEELSLAFEGMTASIQSYIERVSSLTADKERIGTELGVAKQIQTSMLPCIFPAFPEREEIDIFASMEPAKEVGGDFYDFFLVDDRHLCVVIADVSGKGIPAALFMVVSKTLLKDNVLSGRPLSQVFERVNSQLCENNEAEMFVTAFLGVLDLESGRLSYVNAGHNPPVIRRGDGELLWLSAPSGFVLAGMDGMTYEEGVCVLGEGDLFFAYTDGVTEATNTEGEFYGEGRLSAYISEHWNERSAAPAMVWSVREAVRLFAKDAEQADDITMLALKYEGRTKRHCLVVDAHKQELFRVQEFLGRRLAQAGGGEEMIKRILVAAEEVFTNIVQYAYAGAPVKAKSVEIACTFRQGRARITFSDSGIPFNPLEHADPDISLEAGERPVGGLGIYLVKASVDEVQYKYSGGRNVLTLTQVLTA